MFRCVSTNIGSLLRSQSFRPGVELSKFPRVATFSHPSMRPLATCVTRNTYETQLLCANSVLANFKRNNSNASFFTKVNAEQLWKGVTTVSNAGKRRGRGQGINKKVAKDLNRGQIIGIGKANIRWPGLSGPIIRGREVVEMQKLPPDPDREANLIKMRDSMGRFRPLRLSPLERGWAGVRITGRSVGPPDPIGQDNFEGFDTRVMEMKTVASMDGNLGKIRTFSCMAITGNKKGLVGLAIGRSTEGKPAIKRAKNRAAQKLVYIERHNDHTVLHDFFTHFGKTKIFVYKKPEGFGLVCHRAIKTMCQLIGIKDLYAKVEGARNMQHLVKAFMLGLLRQKSHDDLANMKQLYLVEQREDRCNFPKVVGVPESCRTAEQIKQEEILDFSMAGFDDRLPLRRRKHQPFYMHRPGWQYHLLKTEHKRNHYKTRVELLAHYGGTNLHCKSWLTKDYPEADAWYKTLLHRKALSARALEEDN